MIITHGNKRMVKHRIISCIIVKQRRDKIYGAFMAK